MNGPAKKFVAPALLGLALVLGGCSENEAPDDRQDTNSQTEPQNTEVDKDPTPQSGTGGDSQANPAADAPPAQ